MANSKDQKETYNSDWEEFEREQETIPIVEESEWAEIFTHRQFRADTQAEARTKILFALLAFLRLNSPYNNGTEYRQKLKTMADMASKAARLADEFEKYCAQRIVMISPALDLDSSLRKTVVEPKRLAPFSKAGYSLRQPLKDALEALGKGDTRPENRDVYWFVKILDQIVRTYSDGGGLTRSKSRPGHNDLSFVAKVLDIAKRESGRTIDEGTIINAIRKLKMAKSK